MAARTRSRHCRKPLKERFIDVKRAFLVTPTTDLVHAKLPEEDAEEGKVGKLMKSM